MKENLAFYNHKERINVVFKRTKPKKVLGIITTIHNVFSNVEDKKTEAHMFYNASKGGVDTFDHMCAHYDIGWKNLKMATVCILWASEYCNDKFICHIYISARKHTEV